MPSAHAHYPTQEDALNAALKDAGISDRELVTGDEYSAENWRQMMGPNGEPFQSIFGEDDSGEPQIIQQYWSHSFLDGTTFGPHCINPATGFHYFWG